MSESEHIELFSDDVNDVLGVVPPRIVRWGMTIIFVAVVGLISFSIVFIYPDVVTAPVTIVSKQVHGLTSTIGIMQLPVKGSGKIKAGQHVIIKVENYPYIEYGTIKGIVEEIDSVPTTRGEGSYYKTVIQLPDGPVTNYHKKLGDFQIMYGTAEIITNKRSLFSRFIKPLQLNQNH
mgnify:CR=1 FL=1